VEGYPQIEFFENAYPEHLICRTCHGPAELIVRINPMENKLYCKEHLPEEFRNAVPI